MKEEVKMCSIWIKYVRKAVQTLAGVSRAFICQWRCRRNCNVIRPSNTLNIDMFVLSCKGRDRERAMTPFYGPDHGHF